MHPSLAVAQPSVPGLSRALVTLLAFCCGAIVANIYYAQPIVGLIAPDLGLSGERASLIVSLTQLGYALGLLLLVPLADLLENRRLMVATALLATLSLLLAGTRDHGQGAAFLAYAGLIGFSSVSVQMLVPLAAHLAPEQQRGRVVGNIMGGLLLGILLARPLSSLVADHFGWRLVFIGAAGVMLAIILLLALTLPRRVPEHKASYAGLMRSLLVLLRRYPLLRRRALYQALMFAAFSLYWTAVPLALVIGVSAPGMSVIGLGLTGVMLDFAVQMNMVIGQREVYALDPASRGRLNALYMTSIFLGGAVGSALASGVYAQFGWSGVALLGAGLPTVALVVFLLVADGRRP
ncbi:MFS transporter [Pseudomonas sp. RIT623]|uniref:MFS transporter n=1 Tax=Pseudomonas sp. RIT623 TaxID=2559075 RepID=UPI001070036E|nr:MFS transporter [Pseudomonas sp. RIT623]TFF42540.1 MFS transporter [Pseudomonas sp. RIT623]